MGTSLRSQKLDELAYALSDNALCFQSQGRSMHNLSTFLYYKEKNNEFQGKILPYTAKEKRWECYQPVSCMVLIIFANIRIAIIYEG